MTALTLAAIYFVTWWICLLIVLPFGVRSQDDENSIVPGTVSSAPARPMLLRKMLATSVLAAVVVGGLWFANAKLGLNLESFSNWFGQ